MPAYEYQCNTCDGHFEIRQKMTDGAIEICPACGGSVKRIISGGAGAITRGGSQSASYAGGSRMCEMGGGCCGGGACGAELN